MSSPAEDSRREPPGEADRPSEGAGALPPTLVGGVGYHDLRDFSVGPAVAGWLQQESWPEVVSVQDLSIGPVDVVHRLSWADPPFRRWIVVGSVRRGREPGTVAAYRWDGSLPPDEEIQARVAEAVTGVVGLDNLVIVVAGLEAAPPETCVVEVEPEVEELGHTFTEAVERGAREAARRARSLALDPGEAARLPEAPLGGFAGSNGHPGAGDAPADEAPAAGTPETDAAETDAPRGPH